MGHVRVPVGFASPDNLNDLVKIESALVDTGATWTAIPKSLAERLGLKVIGQVKVRTASGIENLDQSYAYLELNGRKMVAPVLVSDSFPGVLIGVTTLEALGFAVDPGTEQLTDSELLLL
jgi:predicted aspartyl protease